MTDASAYFVAGRGLSPFVSEWLAEVALGPRDQSLLNAAAEAGDEEDTDSEYLFNATYLYSQIGPQAVGSDASPEVLPLAAVLAVYQHDRKLFRGMRWTSQNDHVSRAFQHARELGDLGVAQRLIDNVLSRAGRTSEATRPSALTTRLRSPRRLPIGIGG
jgi:hypothetical protein